MKKVLKSRKDITRVMELRRSGASGKHDTRPNRARTRQTAKAKYMKENGW